MTRSSNPDDEGINLAVLPVPRFAEVDLRAVSHGMFALPEVLEEAGEEITIGADLLVTGLFRARTGRQKNLPIVRSGILSALPDEPFEDRDTGLQYNAYLIEVRSLGGLSGSPVFAFLNQVQLIEGAFELRPRIFLLGLIRGHFDIEEEVFDFIKDRGTIHMGIATVTPVGELAKLLNREDLVKLRRQE